MSEYIGARYIGVDPIHLADGSMISNGFITNFLSVEAAMNDNLFEPVFSESKEEKKSIKPAKKSGKE